MAGGQLHPVSMGCQAAIGSLRSGLAGSAVLVLSQWVFGCEASLDVDLCVFGARRCDQPCVIGGYQLTHLSYDFVRTLIHCVFFTSQSLKGADFGV